MVGLWAHVSANGPEIILCFDDANRAAASMMYRVGRTLDSSSDEWKWIVREGRIDFTLIDEDGKDVHANCAIALRAAPRAFTLSACRQSPKAVDLSGNWTFEQEP